MKKILKNWSHMPGIHCGSVAIRDVMNYFGHRLSEEMCFGLGSGLGFFYIKENSMSPTRVIHLRGPGMEGNFFSLVEGSFYDWKSEDSSNIANSKLIDCIDNNIPSLIQTDIFYLDYYNSSSHFPGHIVVVCGYDDENEIFYLADTNFVELMQVSFDNLINARNSKAKPYPLSNNWFEVNLKARDIKLEQLIPIALKKNAQLMIQGKSTVRGTSSVEKIKEWADDIINWNDIVDLSWSARFAYQVIKMRGTCGAGFRWMYKDFLIEAEQILPVLSDLGLSEQMTIVGNMWSDLSDLLKFISENEINDKQLKDASEMITDLYYLEKNLYTEILGINFNR